MEGREFLPQSRNLCDETIVSTQNTKLRDREHVCFAYLGAFKKKSRSTQKFHVDRRREVLVWTSASNHNK
jgi:hypothetical protein